MKSFIFRLFKAEPVLVISALCAALSMFFVPPSAAYWGYIDWKVLGMLFSLMSVVAGMESCGAFRVLSQQLLQRCHSLRLVRLALVLLPFFTSMLITNDVALITFVPFAIVVLTRIGCTEQLIPVIVLQTIAANLGSMVTPVGNPQSLYLYTKYQIPLATYFSIMLPLTLVSLIGLSAAVLCVKEQTISVSFERKETLENKKIFALYAGLFLLALASVGRLLDYRVVVAAVAVGMLLFDRERFRKVDYCLLLTFVCFFIFSGNLGNLPAVKNLLSSMLNWSTIGTGVLASQIISNVPTALLLSAFTDNGTGLLLGVNIGGLGTIIASLASLISFKLYARSPGAEPGKYLLHFTVWSVFGLAVLLAVSAVIL